MRSATKPDETERLLTTEEAASFLRISPWTLIYWRIRGLDGPAWIRLGGLRGGRVRYSMRDLMAYLHRRTVRVKATQAVKVG